MSGTVFMLEGDDWEPIGYVADDGVQLTCEEDEPEAPYDLGLVNGELSFSCRFEPLCDAFDALGSIADERQRYLLGIFFEHTMFRGMRRMRCKELRASFARKRKFGGTRNHKGGRL